MLYLVVTTTKLRLGLVQIICNDAFCEELQCRLGHTSCIATRKLQEQQCAVMRFEKILLISG